MTAKTKLMMPTAVHQQLRDDLYNVLCQHGKMPTNEAVGVMAQLLGHVLAAAKYNSTLDDQIDAIVHNIKAGREAALLQLADAQGNA